MLNMNETDYLFTLAIKKLMKTIPLDKITVSQICDECLTTRQTFYRHFKDKYDLVNNIFQMQCSESFLLMGSKYTLEEALIEKFKFIEEEKTFFSQAFKSQDSNNLIKFDFEMIFDFYKKSILSKNKFTTIPKNILIVLELYCRGSIDLTVEWTLGNIDLNYKEMALLLSQSVPDLLKPYILTLGK